MARNNYRGGSSRRAPKDLGRRVKKKPCAMCREGVDWVDYKDVPVLRKYMSDRGKIRSRRVTGNCAQHQRDIARAIKVARELVLLPYTQRTVTEKPGGRGGRGERGPRGDRSGGDRGGPPAESARGGGPPAESARGGGPPTESARGGGPPTAVANGGEAAVAAPAPSEEAAGGEAPADAGPQAEAPPASNGAEAAAVPEVDGPVEDGSADGGDSEGGGDQ
jgi:small subunit ribosomal protein S18